MPDLNLAVASGTGSDADGGDGEALADRLGHGRRYQLEHNRKGSRSFKGHGILEQGAASSDILGLDTQADLVD